MDKQDILDLIKPARRRIPLHKGLRRCKKCGRVLKVTKSHQCKGKK